MLEISNYICSPFGLIVLAGILLVLLGILFPKINKKR